MSPRFGRIIVAIFLSAFLTTAPQAVSAAPRVETNVVYGMYSGLALLMDVHYPETPNGRGVILIFGSGYNAPPGFDAPPLKDNVTPAFTGGQALLNAGYTLFAINHRAAIRFPYPAAYEDAQRAVRFVRHHAARFGIAPDRIGALGASSGATVALMLGGLDGDEWADPTSPIDRESAKVQAIVTLAAPTYFASPLPVGAMSFLDVRSLHTRQEELARMEDASPLSYVTPDDPPVLLVHGDADPAVPFSNSERFLAALRQQGAVGELLRVPGGGHGGWEALPDPPDVQGAVVGWFDRHLGPDLGPATIPSAPPPPAAQPRIESNVVYGMYSGLALLMDVHYPESPNGRGIIIVPGMNFHGQLTPDAGQDKDQVTRRYFGAGELLNRGYTLFAVNYRLAPRFPYPAAYEDARRAVRFVRHHANRFGVAPDHIGALGYSAGATVALAAGVFDDADRAATAPTIDGESSRLQAVVAVAAPMDLSEGVARTPAITMSFLDFSSLHSTREEAARLRDASPISHLSADDPPVLLVHGDADAGVPYAQAEAFLARLQALEVPGELLRIPGGAHAGWDALPDPPDYRTAIADWFDRYLRD